MTTTQDTPQIAVRLDFEHHAAGFYRAIAHLDQAATRELDKADVDPRLRELVRQQGVRRVVVGLPVHMDGSPSAMSEEARSFAARAEKAIGLPVEMMDERLSSWEAHQTLAGMNSSKRARRSSPGRSETMKQIPVDDVAAAIILRDYLARARNGSRA